MGKKEIKEIKKKLKEKKNDGKWKENAEKKEAEKKRKPKYGFFSCIGYMLKFIWKADKKLAVFAVALIPITLIMSVLGLFVPPKIVEIISIGTDFSEIALVIFGMLTVIGFFTVVISLLRTFEGYSKQLLQERMS